MSIEIMLKILNQTSLRKKVKRTPLALYSHMSYSNFIKYLKVMEKLDLLKIVEEKDETFVIVTEAGLNTLIAFNKK